MKNKFDISDLPNEVIMKMIKDPVFYCRVTFNTYLWSKQREIAWALTKSKRVSVYSCTGAGKSFLEANIIHWFLQTHPNSVVVLTGSSFKQAKRTVWRVVVDLYHKSRIKLLGEPTAESWSITKGQWYAEVISGKRIEALQGLHAPYMLFVLDEASGIDEFVYDAVMGNLSGGDAYVLLCGNPLRPEGEFYRTLFDPSYYKVKISVFDTPLFTGEIEEIPEPYKSKLVKVLPSPKWVEDMRQKYGEDSAFWKAKILAEFPTESEMGLFNINDIEYCYKNEDISEGSDVYITCDVARYGDDESVITVWKGMRMVELIPFANNNLMEIVGRIVNLNNRYKADFIVIDSTGLGSGVVDRLIELGYDNVYAVNFSQSAFESDKYVNIATEMFFHLSDMVKEHKVKLIPELVGFKQ